MGKDFQVRYKIIIIPRILTSLKKRDISKIMDVISNNCIYTKI